MARVIAFTRLRFVMIAVSVVAIALGIGLTASQGGFNFGIDFQAGLELQVEIDGVPSVERVRQVLSPIDGAQVQAIGAADSEQYSIRVRDAGVLDQFSEVMSGSVIDALEAEFGDGSVRELQSSYVGPRFSEDLTEQAILLTTLALGLILIYIWFRFRLAYAVSAIAALLHDVLFMVGFIGTFQIEVSTATIAAVLTIIGYSLNDTIVIFDRIRENETLLRDAPYETIVNTSISQSLGRTLITSLTTLLAVVSIYVFATGAIQAFALNLIVGIVIGTYSSVFIASPVLLGWQRRSRARRRKKDLERYGSTSVTEERKEVPKTDESGKPKTPAGVAAEDIEAVRREVTKKRQSSGGKSQPRSKRKKGRD
jgi:preprotein translocase subunit SecF